MARPKAASWSQFHESWDCRCDTWVWEKKLAICCHLIPKSLWSRCSPESPRGGTEEGIIWVSGGNWRSVSLSCGWFYASCEVCSNPESPPNQLKILWRVYHHPKDVVRKIDLARWHWQSP